MIKIEFTEADKQALNYERFHHPHPRVQQKMEALWLKSQSLPHHQIATLADIHQNTLCAYLKEYLEGGIERLKEINFYHPESELIKHQESLEVYFQKHPPATVNEASAKIEQLTGIKRSPTQVRLFLKKLGMRCLKVGVIPAKADPDKQAAFKKRIGAAFGRS